VKNVLMCSPTYFTVRDVKNPFMNPATAVDPERAECQWQALRAAFASLGLATHVVEPIADLEDMVFTANQVFVGSGRLHARFVVPSRMRHASRQREVPAFVAWFVARGYDLIDLGLADDADEFLEGHGDLILQPDSSRVWAGYGFRSSAAGIEHFARAMQAEGLDVVPLHLADPTFYHLDTCFAPLNAQAALVYAQAFAPESLASLRRGWKRLHEVSRDDALRFVCNGVAVNGRFIASHVPASLEGMLEREGLAPLRVDTSEFEKSGGSVFCMKTLF
jgi:N-dimethylarginine dimethylaminohydrolase